jgi:hypothetical protein
VRDLGYLPRILASADALARPEFEPTRRGFILAALLSTLPVALLSSAAHAGAINPSETSVALPDAIEWSSWIKGFPPDSAEMATLYGGLDKPGPYVVFMKWYPGYMSAPHTYATDRLSVVLSGTWWVNSGADFDPANAVPVPAGGFVRRCDVFKPFPRCANAAPCSCHGHGSMHQINPHYKISARGAAVAICRRFPARRRNGYLARPAAWLP